ncbi:MAG: formylglycine-generating enzyme family protein [Phycisphaerae bacterium]|nr:formylglycine-generating enzyme family protein [Phycisphaerae bacterium]
MNRFNGIKLRSSALIVAAVFCLSGLLGAACPSMDLTGNCRVDLHDFALLAKDWISVYDMDDLAALAEQWLTEGLPDITWVAIEDPNFVGEMSRYETTNAQYAQFLNTALHSGDIIVDPADPNYIIAAAGEYQGKRLYQLNGPGKPEDVVTDGGASRIIHNDGIFTVASGFEDHPVTYVSLYGASMFADYYGWRLPTEEEWQGVANYYGNFIYGCGETIDNTKANYLGSDHPDGTTSVGGFGYYGYGMADLAGNVQEWTTTVGDNDETSFATKGGWWFANETFCVIDSKTPARSAGMYRYLGFRVCR